MKIPRVISVVIVTISLIWLGSSLNNVRKAKNRAGIILSPDKSKSIEFVKSIGTNQVLINYHKILIVASSNITSGDFNRNDLVINWIDNNSISIEYSKGSNFTSKVRVLYFFNDKISVKYKLLPSK